MLMLPITVEIWFWISNGRKKVGLQMVRISNGIWNPETQTFEIRINATILSKTIWSPDKNVQITDFEWSGF